MKKRTLFFGVIAVLAALVLVFTACGPGPGGDDLPPPADPVVYVAGMYDNDPCYWVDDELHILGGIDDTAGYACAITVASDGSVYTAGTYNGGTKSCYWMDQVKVKDLPGDSVNPKAIAVVNGSVYVAGTHFDGGTKYTYWIDGVKQDDFEPTDFWVNHATVASNGDIYYCGYSMGGSNDVACYWRNVESDRTDLPESSDSYANRIAVVNGTVYIAGEYGDSVDWSYCQWVDEEKTDFSGGCSSMDAITASGGKAYVAGKDSGGNACYWVNGSPETLELHPTGTDTYTKGIAALDGVAYVAGYYDDIHGHLEGIACYWVDGELIDLGEDVDSIANGIYVK